MPSQLPLLAFGWIPILALVGVAPGTTRTGTAPLAVGPWLDQVQTAVDAVLTRNGPPDVHRRTRRSTWNECGATATVVIEEDDAGVSITEVMAASRDGSDCYPDQWRVRGMASIQVGTPVDTARLLLTEWGASPSTAALPEPGKENWHYLDASYSLTLAQDGTLITVEVRRVMDDWESAVARRAAFDLLGERTTDEETEQWTWTGRQERLVRSGDRVNGEWTVYFEPWG